MTHPHDDRVGLCVDIDGTLYRESSVFVEVVSALAVRSPALERSARARLRETIGLVGEFHGTAATRWRWEQTLRGLERLRQYAGRHTAGEAFQLLQRLRGRLEGWVPAADARAGGDPAARERFQHRLLGTYGQAISGAEQTTLAMAGRDQLRRLQPVDPRTNQALVRLASAGVDIALITDMPTHIAAAFADVVLDAPVVAVCGTQFKTDPAGAFTGAYDRIDKGRRLKRISTDHDWETTVAAGDTDRDAAMAPHADAFLAVAGHGGVHRALADKRLPGTLRSVSADQSFGDVLLKQWLLQ